MSDPHVVSALTAKYARLSGELRKLDRQAAGLRKDLLHIEATLRLFRQDWDGGAVRPVGSNRPSRWGSRGEGVRLAFDVLRDASEPLLAREIAARVLALRGIELPDRKTLSEVTGAIASSLQRRVGDGIVMYEGKPPRWSVEGRGVDAGDEAP